MPLLQMRQAQRNNRIRILSQAPVDSTTYTLPVVMAERSRRRSVSSPVTPNDQNDQTPTKNTPLYINVQGRVLISAISFSGETEHI